MCANSCSVAHQWKCLSIFLTESIIIARIMQQTMDLDHVPIPKE